jgi:hypothetical protein
MGSAAEKTKLFLREENSGFVHVIFYQCAAVHVLYGTTVVSRRKQPSRHISFEFLFIKTCPPDKLHNGFYFVVQFRVGIRYLSVRGASFDKIEFKRNVAGRLLTPLSILERFKVCLSVCLVRSGLYLLSSRVSVLV